MKLVIYIILLTCMAQVSLGQQVMLNDSTDSFGSQLSSLLENTNNAEAVQIGQDFNAVWPSAFSVNQQHAVIDIAIQMQKKNTPQFHISETFLEP